MRDYTVDEMFQIGVHNYKRVEKLVGYIIPEQVDTSYYCDREFTEEECQRLATYIRANCPPEKKFRIPPPEVDFATSRRMASIAWAEIDAGLNPIAANGGLILIAISIVLGFLGVFK